MAGPSMLGEESSSYRRRTATERRSHRRKLYENGANEGAAIPTSFQQRRSSHHNKESALFDNERFPHCSPEEHFKNLLHERGYSIPLLETLDSDYCISISEEQLASYGPYMVKIVRHRDAKALSAVLACGLSPNACNKYGESLLHMVCRRGNHELLEIMINNGVNLQVADDYGKTPLHDAFWASDPAYDVVNTLLKIDYTMLFMKDRRGHLPLSYVHVEDWNDWKTWVNEMVEEYFPVRPGGARGTLRRSACCSPNQNFRDELLSIELMTMVAGGRITPEEATALAQYNSDDEDEDEDDDTQLDTECAYFDSEHESVYTDDDDDSSYCEMENVEILEILKVASIASTKRQGMKLDTLIVETDPMSLFLSNGQTMMAPKKAQQQPILEEEEEESDADIDKDKQIQPQSHIVQPEILLSTENQKEIAGDGFLLEELRSMVEQQGEQYQEYKEQNDDGEDGQFFALLSELVEGH